MLGAFEVFGGMTASRNEYCPAHQEYYYLRMLAQTQSTLYFDVMMFVRGDTSIGAVCNF